MVGILRISASGYQTSWRKEGYVVLLLSTLSGVWVKFLLE
jgi:hypothetical protein